MKYSVIKMTLVVGYLLLVSSNLLAKEISFDDAFEPVKSHFSDREEALFYLVEQSIDEDVWTFFVDLAPGFGWEHDCCLVEVSRFVDEEAIIEKITELRFPPKSKMTLISTNVDFIKPVRSAPQLITQPCVEKRVLSRKDSIMAKKTYAIILSGGLNANANHSRYWNDCSFLYQTLVNRYGIPKENIHVAISDGTDESDLTGKDMNLDTSYGVMCSSPLDLDFDGQPDTRYTATKDGLRNAINSIGKNIADNDHFFLFVIDHGGFDVVRGSYICLWDDPQKNYGDYRLFGDELNQMLYQINAKKIVKSAVLGQCYSGGFIDSLQGEGYVIATATRDDELSSAMNGHVFDTFVYNWICAINSADELKHTIYADKNYDGKISMEEAFNYAAKCNTISTEHPQYSSIPSRLGFELSFGDIPSLKPELYVRDHESDDGIEQNNSVINFWNSPDIWLSMSKNGSNAVDYFLPDSIAFINISIHNRGIETYSGDQWLKVYWTIASPTVTADDWLGENGKIGGIAWSGRIEEDIAPGDSVIIVKPWMLNLNARNNSIKNGNINLMAVISDSPYFKLDNLYSISGNKRIANKNRSIYKLGKTNKYSISIRNTSDAPKWYSIEPINTEKPYSSADICAELAFDSKLYQFWSTGGYKSKDCKRIGNTIYTNKLCAVIDSILIPAHQSGNISICFTPGANYNAGLGLKNHSFDFVVKANHEVVGGISYIVGNRNPVVGSKKIGQSSYLLSVGIDDDIEYLSWFDADGGEIGTGENIVIDTEINGNEIFVEAQFTDGYIGQSQIILNPVENYIKNISLNEEKTMIEIEFNQNATTGSIIGIAELSGVNGYQQHIIQEETTKIGVEISTLPSGYYVLSYSVGGEFVESLIFRK